MIRLSHGGVRGPQVDPSRASNQDYAKRSRGSKINRLSQTNRARTSCPPAMRSTPTPRAGSPCFVRFLVRFFLVPSFMLQNVTHGGGGHGCHIGTIDRILRERAERGSGRGASQTQERIELLAKKGDLEGAKVHERVMQQIARFEQQSAPEAANR